MDILSFLQNSLTAELPEKIDDALSTSKVWAADDNSFVDAISALFPCLKLISPAAKAYHTVLAVRDKFLLQKTTKFIYALRHKSLTQDQIDKYAEDLNGNKKKMERELSHIVIIIDNCNESIKMEFLANLYIKYIIGDIEWNVFYQFTTWVQDLSIVDLDELYDLEIVHNGSYPMGYEKAIFSALSALESRGIILTAKLSSHPLSSDGNNEKYLALVTDEGKLFSQIIFEGLDWISMLKDADFDVEE